MANVVSHRYGKKGFEPGESQPGTAERSEAAGPDRLHSVRIPSRTFPQFVRSRA
ncbi:hypothetical protein AArcCO_0700 [Halalkaliarchaeum sp. AArc-CO]|nr:hypothetical protein AArcCO_0700 [Halalkaliarchaeum sp. AArc-CO]